MSAHNVRIVILAILGSAGFAKAEEAAKPAEAPPPSVLMSHPVAVVSGTTTRVVLRGTRLDEIAAVLTPARVDVPGVEILKIIKKEKNPPPQEYPAERAGDSRVEVELRIPDDAPPRFMLTVVDANRRTASWEVPCLRPAAVDKETEPNDGFKQTQPPAWGRSVLGEIHEPRNVDVFRIEPTGTRRVRVEVLVSPSRSLLDPLLTLHAADGRLLAAYDDSSTTGTADLRWELPSADDVRYLVLYDANDRGGPTHGYLLRLEEIK